MTVGRNVNSIDDLAGEAVADVCFPADYVELRFAGPILRLLLYPVSVERGRTRADFPAPGSRDVLRSLIGLSVSRAGIDASQLTLSFSDDASLVARIDESDRRGPESVQFVPWENGRLNVAAMEVL
jgi:hypothetical protein